MGFPQDLNDPELRARAVRAARGLAPFDLLITGAQVMDMVTGRIRAADVGLIGPLIASVHAPGSRSDAGEVLKAEGQTLVPGFIDTHMHVESSMVGPAAYAEAVVPRGVTTALWDPHELANVAGEAGLAHACAEAAAVPLRLMPLMPTCVPSAPGYEASGGDFDAGVVARWLARDDIQGAAELMTMHPLLDGDPRVTGIANAALESGKRLCGHGRGLTGGDLAGFAAAGVETDHELTSAADLMAKLEAGFTIELRGSHAHLLPEFAEALLALGEMPQTVTLCTDDVFPDDLLHRGGLDAVIRMLIQCGLPPLWAYRAATLNAASRIGRGDLGLVAPGRRADLVLLADVAAVKAAAVITDGKLVAEGGAMRTAPSPLPLPAALRDTMKMAPLTEADFEIAAEGSSARIATLSKPRFPEWGEREVAVEEGRLVLPDDMIRMAVINRHGAGTPPRVAFLENWGTWRGAFATSVSHDSHNLTIFGRDPADMAAAGNALREAGGGLAVAQGGEVSHLLALPIAGLYSDAPLEEIAAQFAAIRAEMDRLVDWQPPYLVFKALFGASLVCNPGPRLSDMGLVDVFEKKRLESCLL
ncbi:Adenine deaminase [Pseudooceanicola antarcticus]|uniref:Adenine deaminase n=1 Tax=Pseudooceanicola antarcticus TaxID=1247613 RepID=A0A285HZ92_9RHOB|nr:adenine deaminase C-terminal domain-containing protein [Pseudooceanicola antarcticus]PJE30330.1 adenine deaminase [Pseudooceanicola antarcticus]SNY41014.1 Adenine deaminase [Pseudooceanicola antarcticus]